MMEPKLCFVQFIHPGKEHKPDRADGRSWNRGEHRRTFIANPGRYLDEDGLHERDICFWGEWEAQCDVIERIGHTLPDGPRYVCRPYYQPITEPGHWQNTDPFVYGDHFHYACCKQNHGSNPTQLRYLARGSVILFGSCLGRQHFVVDTVIVIDHGVGYSVRNYAAQIGSLISREYEDVTISRLTRDTSFTLYFGATYSGPVEGMFSFFPCLPYQRGGRGFPRPAIALPGIITDNLTQGHRLNPGTSAATARKLWESVVDQVVAQKLSLGVWTELPRRRLANTGTIPAPPPAKSRRCV